MAGIAAVTAQTAASAPNAAQVRRTVPVARAAVVRKRKPRQEISACLKWICFFSNFLIFLAGVFLLALGLYLCVKDPREIAEWADVALNPAVVLSILGSIVCCISLTGSIGALRDNVCLLRTFAVMVFLVYIACVGLTFLLFILFYSDTADGLSAHSILLYSIRNYHTNRNLADAVDYMQEQLECCGASSASQGFRDWATSPQFNCSASNPYPERCGVPFSCCRRFVVSEAAGKAGSSNPLLPAMRSLECWQNALNKKVQDLEGDIHTKGCLQPLRVLFETHAVHLGTAVAIIIIPVCIAICMSNVLARQIDHQRYLLDREAKRNERCRRKRERYRPTGGDLLSSMEEGRKETTSRGSPHDNNTASTSATGRGGSGGAAKSRVIPSAPLPASSGLLVQAEVVPRPPERPPPARPPPNGRKRAAKSRDPSAGNSTNSATPQRTPAGIPPALAAAAHSALCTSKLPPHVPPSKRDVNARVKQWILEQGGSSSAAAALSDDPKRKKKS